MSTPLHEKSSLDEIRTRFDADVERFSNLETGQEATIDAPLAMDLITQAAIAATPTIRRVLDIGCGAANNTIKLRREYGQDFDCDICDLSLPMLERAEERISAENAGLITVYQGDFRDIAFPTNSFDVVIAAAVLHHLRDDDDWAAAFEMIFHLLRPGGSFWITDLVAHESGSVHALMWNRYGQYLSELGGTEYAEKVFAYIDKEDSPRSVTFQIELMHQVGFRPVDILHKNSCFAAFGGIKPIIGR